MPSEVRRPAHIHLDRFVETLDARLRQEVVKTRRIRLPVRVNYVLRAVKVRALAVLQGGALALTALAVIVAVGIAPAVRPDAAFISNGPLAAPTLSDHSLQVMKGETSAVLAARTEVAGAVSPGITK